MWANTADANDALSPPLRDLCDGLTALHMWDNCATQHFVLNDFQEERVIQRVSIMGDRVEAAAPSRWPVFTHAGTASDTSLHDAILDGLED